MKTVCGEREQPPNTPSFLTQPKVILDDEHTAQTPALQAVVLLTGCVVWVEGGQSQCPLPCSSMWTLPLPTYKAHNLNIPCWSLFLEIMLYLKRPSSNPDPAPHLLSATALKGREKPRHPETEAFTP